MAQQMVAEIIFLEGQDDLNAGIAGLVARGFEVQVLPWVDEDDDGERLSDAIWIKAKIESELDKNRFFLWERHIVDRLGGADLIEAGYARPQ